MGDKLPLRYEKRCKGYTLFLLRQIKAYKKR